MGQSAEPALADLMRQAVAGDALAYRGFLKAALPLVRHIVNARAGGLSQQQREDIVQDVLLGIHLKRHTWRQDHPILPWLYAITRYKVIDALRRRKTQPHYDVDEMADQLAARSHDPVAHLDAAKLLGMLDGRSGEVVRAISLKGQSIEEAAAQLGMKETAVRVALHRGLKKLAEMRKSMFE